MLKCRRLVIALWPIAGFISAQAQVVETIAGGGQLVSPVPASSIPTGPAGTAVGPDGSIFIADIDHNRIWRIDRANNTVQVVAGIGDLNFGFSGDGGPAISATLGYPSDVTVDAAGNVYIADSNNHRIRKVSIATGTITTYAGTGQPEFSGDGGPATQAGLNLPRRVSVDASGNLYIVDTNNNRIRRVDAATGNIATVAGNGSVGTVTDGMLATDAPLYLYGEGDVAIDATGNLFLAESMNSRVWRVDATTGLLTIVVGGYGFSGDGAPASAALIAGARGLDFDAAGNLYIADSGNYRVRRIDTSGIISTIAGNGMDAYNGDGELALSASLHFPQYISVAQNGDLLISDRDNSRLRMVRAQDQVIDAYAGNGTWSYGGDDGPALSAFLNGPNDTARDAQGNLYIADLGNNRIRKVDINGIMTTIAGSEWGDSGDGGPAVDAKFGQPSGIAIDTEGNLYFTDLDFHRVKRIHATTGIITTIAGTGLGGYSADGIPAVFASLNSPRDLQVDASGSLYVAETGNARVRKIDRATGLISTVAGNGTFNGPLGDGGPAASARVWPWSIALDGNGDLLIADYLRVRKVTMATGVISTVAGNGLETLPGIPNGDGGSAINAYISPNAVAAHPSGDIYIGSAASIRRISATTGTINTIAGGGTSGFNGDGAASSRLFYSPVGLFMDSTNDALVFADAGTNLVRRIVELVPPDATAPQIDVAVEGVQGNLGWYRSNVSVVWTVTDPESAISTAGCSQTLLTSDTAGITYTCTASSDGGTSTRSVTIKRDATVPTLTFGAASPAANAAGWHNTDVSFAFTASDATSGVASTSPVSSPVNLSSEGAAVRATVAVTDVAGNVVTRLTDPVSIDKTLPTIQIASPLAGASFGFYANAAASYSCGDSLSGAIGCAGNVPTGTNLDTTHAGSQSFLVSATDAAGNNATSTITYNVAAQFTFNGFLAPIANPPAVNWIQGGSTIAMTWTLPDGRGGHVDNLQSVANIDMTNISCPSGSKVNVGGNAGPLGLTFDSSSQQFVYRFGTASSDRGCRRVTVHLKDGSTRSAFFRMK